jgi:tetratricopeptide (TPR) repeat protein
MLRGRVLHFTGDHESAARAYESAVDIARAMHSNPRELRVLQRLTGFYATSGNLERAAQTLALARVLADESGEPLVLASFAMLESDLADRRGDRVTQRRAALAAVANARKAGSAQVLMFALGFAAHMSLQAEDYRASLRYSEEGLALSRENRRSAVYRARLLVRDGVLLTDD